MSTEFLLIKNIFTSLNLYFNRDVCQNILDFFFEIQKQKIMYTLNLLGPMYHTGIGFHEIVVEDFYISWSDDDLVYLFALKMKNEDQKIRIRGLRYNDEDDSEDAEEFKIHGLGSYVEDFSKTVVEFDRVVIMYQKDEWSGYPKKWYNENNNYGPITNRSFSTLPPLKTRKHIKVVKSFMNVVVSSQKGVKITVDDILFATRALALDSNRSIDGYDFLKMEIIKGKTTLFIEPIIDNFST